MALGWTWLALFGLFAAAGAAFTRSLHGALDSSEVLLVRGLVWMAWLVPWALAHRREVAGSHNFWLPLSGLTGLGTLYTSVEAFFRLPLPIATTLIYGATPMFVLLLDLVLYLRRPRLVEVLLVAGLAVGVALISLPEGQHSAGSLDLFGVGMALAGGGCVAAYIHEIPRAAAPAHLLNLWMAGATLLFCLPAVAVAPPPRWEPLAVGKAALYGVCALVSQTFAVLGTRLAGPRASGAASALIPVFATGVAWAALGERVSPLEALGVCVVVACAAGVSARERHAGGPPPFWWQAQARRRKETRSNSRSL